MGLKSFKPTSAARRYYSVSDFAEITKSEPERSLLEHQTSTGGRNHHGRITSRFRGDDPDPDRHALHSTAPRRAPQRGGTS